MKKGQKKKVSVINRRQVKRDALEYCKASRAWEATEVSESFVNWAEAYLLAAMHVRILKHPSRGKTIT